MVTTTLRLPIPILYDLFSWMECARGMCLWPSPGLGPELGFVISFGLNPCPTPGFGLEFAATATALLLSCFGPDPCPAPGLGPDSADHTSSLDDDSLLVNCHFDSFNSSRASTAWISGLSIIGRRRKKMKYANNLAICVVWNWIGLIELVSLRMCVFQNIWCMNL